GAGQHAQQRHLGQRDGGGAVVHHRDLVAGEGELVAAAGAGAVQRGEELEARVLARVLDAVPRLVGELAEVHLPRVARRAEHVDIGAGAEHAALAARDYHRLHLGMLEADAVQGVGELDVDAEVVAVQLQLVARHQAVVFRDVERQGGERAVEGELPVVVALGVRLEADHAMAFLRSARLCLTVLPEVSRVASARAYSPARSSSSFLISSSAAERPLNGRMSPCAMTRAICSSGFVFNQTQKQRASSCLYVSAAVTRLPPAAITARGCWARTRSSARRSKRRKASWPYMANTSPSSAPASFSTSLSSSTNGTFSASASFAPSVDLPAPRNPIRATSSFFPVSRTSASSGMPMARASSRRRSTEMFPWPASSWARKRSETPEAAARALRVVACSARQARTRSPSWIRKSFSRTALKGEMACEL